MKPPRIVTNEHLVMLTDQECYAGVDVFGEYAKAQRWILANPKRNLTVAFFHRWLQKCPVRPTLPKHNFNDLF